MCAQSSERNFGSNFRKELTPQIIKQLEDSNSSLIIGLHAIGKSNFLRFLKKLPEKTFRGDKTVLIVLVDLNEITGPSEIEFFRLFLKRLTEAIHFSIKIVAEDKKFTNELYLEAIKSEDQLLILEQIRKLINFFCNIKKIKLGVLMDRFERTYKYFSAYFFDNLRSLRDSAKENFCYVIAVNKDPLMECSLEKIEELYEIIGSYTFYLGPYNKEDSFNIIEQELKNIGRSLTTNQKESIYKKAGGHPRLMKDCLRLLNKIGDNYDDEKIFPRIIEDPMVQMELKLILSNLSKEEQSVLTRLAFGETASMYPDKILQSLKNYGLLTDELKIFCPIFEEFLRKNEVLQREITNIPDRGIYFEGTTQRVFLDAQEITEKLTNQENKLLLYLYAHPMKICERDEVAKSIWGEEASEGVSDEAIDQVVARLRSKIEKEKRSPRYIITVRGRGFQFRNQQR